MLAFFLRVNCAAEIGTKPFFRSGCKMEQIFTVEDVASAFCNVIVFDIVFVFLFATYQDLVCPHKAG